MAHSTNWRGEMETNQAKTMGLINGLAQWLKSRDDKQRKINWAHLVHMGITLALVGWVIWGR